MELFGEFTACDSLQTFNYQTLWLLMIMNNLYDIRRIGICFTANSKLEKTLEALKALKGFKELYRGLKSFKELQRGLEANHIYQ